MQAEAGFVEAPDEESGYSLIEVITVVGVLSAVLAMTVSILWSVQSGISKATSRSQSNDAVRLAVQEIDRQVRSGNVLYDPGLENDPVNGILPGLSLRIYTQANATTNNPASRCVQWRVRDRTLEVRSWSRSWDVDGVVTGWRAVVGDIANHAGDPAFLREGSADPIIRIVRVSLVAQDSSRAGEPVRIDASVTGRNTQSTYESNVCGEIPPYPS